MKYLEDVTRANGRDCIKFVPHTVETHWVNVFPGDGCYSSVGREFRAGAQNLSLARPGCLVNAIVAHEFMHALGKFIFLNHLTILNFINSRNSITK